MKNRKRKRGFFWYVGFMFTVGFIALVSFTCISIKVKAEKDGTTFGQTLVSLFTPQKQVKETYTGAGGELPSLEKISEKQKAEKALQAPSQLTQGNGTAKAAKPVAYSAPTKKADEYGVCPSCKHFHNLARSCADEAAYDKGTVKKSTAAKAKKQTAYTSAKPNQKPAQTVEPDLQLIRNWQTADNTPQAGRTVGAPKFGDMGQMSDLEKQAAYSARNEKAWKELENATAKLRNGGNQ